MGRILPRLLARRDPVSYEKLFLPRRCPRSLYRPVPPRPSLCAADHPRSILLADAATNVITASRVHVRHKTLPPLPRRFDRPRQRKSAQFDQPRAMTLDERRFSSSPYLRMLASPLRQCIISDRFLPSDFLVRLAIQRVPKSHLPQKSKGRAGQTLLPDGLQHSMFTARRSDKANYVPCTRAAIALLSDPSVKRRAAQGVTVHPLLADHIAHLLRLRVLQELDLLADNAKPPTSSSSPAPTPLLRRLTRPELDTIRTTHTIPHPGALAVLIVPPLQNDPATGLRPAPNMSPAPPPPDASPPPKNPLTLPACVLLPTSPPQWPHDAGDGIMPQERIPLYNGVVLFPERGQRAALEALLRRLLQLEWRPGKSPAEGQKSKMSHAFLLSSDEESVLRGDTVGVAIALWRLRMFEDTGVDLEMHSAAGWEWTNKTI